MSSTRRRCCGRIATRFQADTDMFMVPDVFCNRLDPSSRDGMSAKLALDATAPLKWDVERRRRHQGGRRLGSGDPGTKLQAVCRNIPKRPGSESSHPVGGTHDSTASYFGSAARRSRSRVSAPSMPRRRRRTKVKIRLDWKAGAQHAPFYLGKQRGYYKDEGIDLDVISGSGSSDTVKQIGSEGGRVRPGRRSGSGAGAQQRVPAKSIAAYYQRTPIVLISPQAKPITNPRQLLDGIKLGSKKGSATFQGLIALLAANNMTLEQIKLVDIGFGVQPLLVKQVDAIMGFSMNEPIEAESGRHGGFVDADLGLRGEHLRADDRREPGFHAAEAEVVKSLHEGDAALGRRRRSRIRRPPRSAR